MGKVKKFLIDFFVGLGVGLVLLFIPPISLLGLYSLILLSKFLNVSSEFNLHPYKFVPLGIIYPLILSIIPFVVYAVLPFYKKNHQKDFPHIFLSFIFFFLGVYIIYMFIMWYGLYDFSKGGFGL